jgi:hypothetical protein
VGSMGVDSSKLRLHMRYVCVSQVRLTSDSSTDSNRCISGTCKRTYLKIYRSLTRFPGQFRLVVTCRHWCGPPYSAADFASTV